MSRLNTLQFAPHSTVGTSGGGERRWHPGALSLALGIAALATMPAFVTAPGDSSTNRPARDFLRANMDPTVHPGDDFFAYANAGWLRRNPIPS